MLAAEYTPTMCGRYSLGLTADEIERRFGFTELVETRIPPVAPRWNVAPPTLLSLAGIGSG